AAAAQDRRGRGPDPRHPRAGLHPSAGGGRVTAPAGRTPSLRARLFVLIVVPQLALAVLASVVLHWMARDMSRQLYDDTLKVVAHAVAREVMVTKGDLIAEELLASLEGAIGDPLYYQVHAAGGRFVVGRTDAPPIP